VPQHDRWFYLTFIPQYVRKASRIATVSEYSADDIHQVFGIPRAGIDVVYNGGANNFRPLTPEQLSATATFNKGRPYFLFIGAQHPRKNLSKLFQASTCYVSVVMMPSCHCRPAAMVDAGYPESL
jgi:hypothetical protein